MVKSNKLVQKRAKVLRNIVLLMILIGVTISAYLHLNAKTSKPKGVDALCPFGGIESFYSLITTGSLLNKIDITSFIVLISVMITLFIFRRSFCGNICPLGALQELFGRIRHIFKIKRIIIPAVVDKPLRYLKYLALILIIVFTIITKDLVIRPFDPWVAYNHLFSLSVFSEFLIGFIILVVSLIASIFIDRFFCKYLCPMGGFLGIINKIGWFRVKRNTATCTNCMACNKACPVNIPVQSVEQVQSSECLNCNECINACPVADTLYNGGYLNTRISSLLLLIFTLLIFGSVIGTATITQNINWTMPSLTEETDKQKAFDPDLIKGYMTLEEVSAASGISKAMFLQEFKINEEDFKLPIRDMRDKYNFETQEVRDFIKKQLATP